MPAMRLAVLSIFIGLGGSQAKDPPPSVEGTWERFHTDPNGKTIRAVKEHKDGRTTHTVTTEQGEILSQHESRYELQSGEQVHIFTFLAAAITGGPNIGQKVAGRYSYAYRVERDTFYEVRGILTGDTSPPAVIVWKRVREK